MKGSFPHSALRLPAEVSDTQAGARLRSLGYEAPQRLD